MQPRHAVLIAAAILFFTALGGHDLWAPDEPYFAEGAREMVVDGKWAVPHVNGVVTTDKPPLFFWSIAVLSLPLGAVTPFTARLPSALAALGILLVLLRLGTRFYGPRTAALGAALLATASLFWEKARWSQTDALLCLLIWIALAAFALWRDGAADGRRAALVFGLATGLAVLDKGPVGLLLPLGIVAITLATDRQLRRWRDFSPLAAAAAFVVVAGAWVVLATVAGGEYSVWGALREHFIERGMHGMHHKQPPWYFLETLPVSLLPWTGLIPGALVLAWRRRGRSADRFLLVAALFVVVFFSISTEKRQLYILPSLPAFALLAAAMIGRFAGWGEPGTAGAGTAGAGTAGAGDPGSAETSDAPLDRRWWRIGHGFIAGLLVLVGIALPIVGRSATSSAGAGSTVDLVPYPLICVLAAVLLLCGGLTLHRVWRDQPLAATASLGGGFAVAYLIGAIFLYPALEPRKSSRPFSLRLAAESAESRAAGVPVLAFDLGNLPEAFSFYSNGVYTLEVFDPAVLASHLERGEEAWAAVNGGKLEPLPTALAERLWVVEETVLSRRRVLLITNREQPGARPLASVLAAGDAG